MSFKIIFTSDGEYHALDQVREVMPEAVFPCFKAGLLRQAADPLKLAQPAILPRPDRGKMLYSYECDHEGTRYWFRPYFHYGEEEDTMIIDEV